MSSIDNAKKALFVESTEIKNGTEVHGYNFNNGVNFDELMKSYLTTGFQATSVGQAIDQINEMIKWRLIDDPVLDDDREDEKDPNYRENIRTTIFLGYTSNMISCGMREIIRYLAEHKMVDCIVSTAGGIEEDIMKCLAPTYIGDFTLNGENLRKNGLNRIGNLLVPNKNYCLFEDWITPIFEEMLEKQKEGFSWTPSKFINLLGKTIDNPESVYYWCYKNNIPVYSPALTDGSIGDMLYFNSFKSDLKLDIIEDVQLMNNLTIHSKKTGMIILGGGLIKHHICNSNLMRNGADYTIFINTGQEFDGSDSGARPDEAISWGKIKMGSHPVKVYCDATIVFPIIVAQTFAKHQKIFDDYIKMNL